MGTRVARRMGAKEEMRARKTEAWRPWEHRTFPKGSAGPSGWVYEIDEAYSNGLYAVLVRGAPGGVIHLAIRTPLHAEPPWRDLQRIKNELFGADRVALQVCPAQDRLIDDADMYHLWVMPAGYQLGFGLHALDEAPDDRGLEACRARFDNPLNFSGFNCG